MANNAANQGGLKTFGPEDVVIVGEDGKMYIVTVDEYKNAAHLVPEELSGEPNDLKNSGVAVANMQPIAADGGCACFFLNLTRLT